MGWNCLISNEKELLRSMLAADPIAGAYLRGDLEEPFFSDCRWFVATSDEGGPGGVVLCYSGLSEPCLLSFGEPGAVEALAEAFGQQWPERGVGKFPHEHLPTFERRFVLSARESMRCMSLSQLPDLPPDDGPQRLHPDSDLDPIFALYAHYPGHFFEASALRAGLYFGLWREGRLVCIAGTHVFAPGEGVACLGNIVTATDARGQGLAPRCLAALLGQLRRLGCRHIVLHVNSQNASAIRCYQKLGFGFHSELLDCAIQRP